MPDLVESAKDADFLIFVVPHQFVKGICEQLLGKIKSNAIGISLIKVGHLSIFLTPVYYDSSSLVS